ncbi:hypothetical protein [Mycolicibacterium celeriflavum]|uniref:Uncharacterized protein n=1 Tax=Mycolicibacterium celeriflavum TaxID=1249101 RepID=A0A7I7RHY7_MYCCF|nr:hypothetical protein [Mycolicibacterium celeriflavum]MCV7240422.1 hypothetical protein [Mycolicibacterium celeriflavum]BBY44162.1 hypothetical protein MCEL_24570 [Mycolicibacterium celeriflavum]
MFDLQVREMAKLRRYAKGIVGVDPVELLMDVNDHLLARITRRVKGLPAY